MSRQSDPNTYIVNSRVTLQDAAKMKTVTDGRGISISSFVSGLIHDTVSGVKTTKEAEKWASLRLAENRKQRKHADELTRSGIYRNGGEKHWTMKRSVVLADIP